MNTHKYFHVLLFLAYEQTEYQEPPGGVGLSGYTEERLDECGQTGSTLSLGRK